MKHVIGGKVYDTDTATLIDSIERNIGSYQYVLEELYRTHKGAFFVEGQGGPLSRWREQLSPTSWCRGSGALALTNAEALEWLEDAGTDADAITRLFALEDA